MTNRWMMLWGAALGALGVALGAFAAHGLRAHVTPAMLEVWQTAVRYQLVHALGLLIVFTLSQHWASALLRWSARLMVAGSVCFSGSLYLLVLTGVKWWGPVTPLGGSLLLGGWLLLLLAAIKEK